MKDIESVIFTSLAANNKGRSGDPLYSAAKAAVLISLFPKSAGFD